MSIAIIRTGGKQYIVKEGQKLKIEKIAGEKGDKVKFDEVMLFSNDKIIEIGKPLIKGAKVTATILRQDRYDKIIVFKYKAKKRQQTKKGHRQAFSEVQIDEIIAA